MAYNAKDLTKMKLGISSSALDETIEFMIESVESEFHEVYKIKENDLMRQDIVDLISDYVVFKLNNNYSNMPRHIQARLYNLLFTLDLR